MGDFIKEKVYESVKEADDKRKEVDPKIRIPFSADKIKGHSLGDEVVITLRGKVEGLKVGKDNWENGIEISLSSGDIKGDSKSDEEKTVDSFVEDD